MPGMIIKLVKYGVNDIEMFRLKLKLKEATNNIGEQLDPETVNMISTEGVKVFQLNNLIIGTVKGVDDILWKRLAYFVIILLTFILTYWLIF